MNDSIDQNVYEDLHARVNDGDNGLYGINHPLERLNSSRNQVVLAWDQEEPLLIHTDLKTCQQCGSNMRNKGGEKECKAKRCDKCGWSVMRDGFPALVKLDHGYPMPADADVDKHSGEVVPGYTTQIRYMNQLAHKHRRKTPDVTVSVGEPDNQHRLLGMGNIVDEKQLDGMVDENGELIENMDGNKVAFISIQLVLLLIALALWSYRVFNVRKGELSGLQIMLELCVAVYYPICYIPVVLILTFATGDPQTRRY